MQYILVGSDFCTIKPSGMPFSFYGLERGHGGRVVTLSPPTSEAGGSIPVMAVSGKAGSCLPLVGSLQYRTLANYMYWFPLPFQLPVVI